MTDDAAFSLFRQYLGDPGVDAVPDRNLWPFVVSGLERLVGEFQDTALKTETGFLLVAGTYSYPLPVDCRRLAFVEWNGGRLLPASRHKWAREKTDYLNAASGNPTEYIQQNQDLLLTPPPSAAAITTDPNLTLCYLRHTRERPSAESDSFSDSDLRCALRWAAIDYLGMYPGQDKATMFERQARKQGHEAMLFGKPGQPGELGRAKQRHADPIETYTKRIRLSPRSSAAR